MFQTVASLHIILVLIANEQKPHLNARAEGSYGARGLIFGLSLHLQTSCIQAAKSLASLRTCADSPGPSLLGNATSTKIKYLSIVNLSSTILTILFKFYYVLDCKCKHHDKIYKV